MIKVQYTGFEPATYRYKANVRPTVQSQIIDNTQSRHLRVHGKARYANFIWYLSIYDFFAYSLSTILRYRHAYMYIGSAILRCRQGVSSDLRYITYYINNESELNFIIKSFLVYEVHYETTTGWPPNDLDNYRIKRTPLFSTSSTLFNTLSTQRNSISGNAT